MRGRSSESARAVDGKPLEDWMWPAILYYARSPEITETKDTTIPVAITRHKNHFKWLKKIQGLIHVISGFALRAWRLPEPS